MGKQGSKEQGTRGGWDAMIMTRVVNTTKDPKATDSAISVLVRKQRNRVARGRPLSSPPPRYRRWGVLLIVA